MISRNGHPLIDRTIRIPARLWSVAWAAFVFAVIAAVSPGANASGEWRLAAVERYGVPADLHRRSRPDPLVERIQAALSETGFYDGPVDGRLSDATEEAIRAYQRRNELGVDGAVSEKLAIHLETAANVRGLLQRLEQARDDNIRAAREALLSNPATRHLVEEARTVAPADAARDATPCFESPTAQCLLHEAAESAKAIPKDNMRDWALGELLAAQARAGLVDSAMTTVARIEDPRLIMVALREIAEAQAAVGRSEDALAAVRIIPDRDQRLEALAAIAAIHSRRGEGAAVNGVVEQLIAALEPGDAADDRIGIMTQGATVLAAVGSMAAADDLIARAESLARTQEGEARETALRHVAAALAEMDRPVPALALLDELSGEVDPSTVLIAAAKALARAGATGKALEAAAGIEAARYRAVVLCSIAASRARGGDPAGARGLIERATADVAVIEFPYARSFAMSRVALALSDIGRVEGAGAFRQAVTAAQEIKDKQLQAHVLWTLAAERRRAGDTAGATETEGLAEIASEEIKSALSRVWMYSEIAESHLESGERNEAWSAFRRALFTSEGIENPWARARALSKVAATLIGFTGPDGLIGAAPPP